MLAKYAPEYPCLLKGIVNAAGPQAEAFRGFTLHIVLETLPNQPRGYGPQDDVPRFGDTRGPSCATSLPNPPYSQANPVRTQPDFDDGVDEPTGKGTSRVAPSYGRRDGFRHAGSADLGTGRPDARRAARARASASPPTTCPTSVRCWSGPMARGGEVSLQVKLLDKKTGIDTIKLSIFVS